MQESTGAAGPSSGTAQIPRRTLVSGGLATAAVASTRSAAWASPSAARRRDPRPNIVFILADDLGWGALGSYGQRTLHTPHLDRLAAEGVRFSDAYSSAPICAPSRCATLTGLHTGHTRVRDNTFTYTGVPPQLKHDDLTWAKVLSEHGYATGAYGKWGFGRDDCYKPVGFAAEEDTGGPVGSLKQNVGDPSHPLQQGFDDFLGLITHEHSTDGYFPNYVWRNNKRVLLPENREGAMRTYAPDLYVDRALEFMKENRRRPFAVYLAPQLVHWPDLIPSTEPYDDKPWSTELKRYAAMFTRLDKYVGQVRRQLELLGVADQTLIVFSSDNGTTIERGLTGSGDSATAHAPSEAFLGDKIWHTSGGLRMEKHSLYEGGIRVPLIAWGPGVISRPRRGTIDSTPVAGYDLFPTFLDLAGVRRPSHLDGLSLRPLLNGSGGIRERPLYWERKSADQVFDISPLGFAQAARVGRWKGLRYTGGPDDPHTPDAQWIFQLYDMRADPKERVDVSLLHPEIRRRIERIMNAAHKDKTVTATG